MASYQILFVYEPICDFEKISILLDSSVSVTLLIKLKPNGTETMSILFKILFLWVEHLPAWKQSKMGLESSNLYLLIVMSQLFETKNPHL